MPHRRRGYLMFEILMGGAIVSIILGATFSLIAGARRETATVANRQVAATLARSKAEELRGDAQTTLALTAMAPVGAAWPGFRWQWQVAASGVHAQSVPALTSTDDLHLITVTVQYPGLDGARTVTFQTYREMP
jgi:type II secretory pathway pseudopilin PulG